MEIDLREVQALHARYAREHFVIDLENQVRALPAPLLLAHEPAAAVSPVRKAWNARWRIGRGALMFTGGAAVCAALGMGAARLWPMVHSEQRQSAALSSIQAPLESSAGGPATASSVAATAPALTSQDLGTGSSRANGLAAIDPTALLRPTAQVHETGQPRTAASHATDEQKGLAPPLRQHITQEVQPPASAPQPMKASPVAVATPAVTPPAQKDDQPVPRPVARRAARPHASPTRTEQPASTETAKSGAASAPRSGDVQLF